MSIFRKKNNKGGTDDDDDDGQIGRPRGDFCSDELMLKSRLYIHKFSPKKICKGSNPM